MSNYSAYKELNIYANHVSLDQIVRSVCLQKQVDLGLTTESNYFHRFWNNEPDCLIDHPEKSNNGKEGKI